MRPKLQVLSSQNVSLRANPEPLQDPCGPECKLCAGPKDEATYLDRIARSRRLYFVIAVGWAFVYTAAKLLKEWVA